MSLQETHLQLHLDHNEDIPVRIQLDPERPQDGVKIALDLHYMKSPRLRRHLKQGLAITLPGRRESILPDEMFDLKEQLEAEGEKIPRQDVTLVPDADVGSGESIHWTLPLDQLPEGRLPAVGSEMTISLFGEPVLPLQMHHDGLRMLERRGHERLTGNEIKTFGNSDERPENLPYSRKAMKGFDARYHAPITELHTHLSAQINAVTLVQLAYDHDKAMAPPGITYPVELLQLAGVDVSGLKQIRVPAIKFDPGRNEDVQLECESGEKGATCMAVRVSELSDEQRDAIVRKMRIAQDRKLAFSRFDPEMYRFRNPLTKRAELNYDIIMSVAEDCQKNGIRYSELSATGMLNDPKWFAEMIRAVDDAKAKYGVDLRFLAAVPRSFDPPQMMRELEKVKYAARHPYVVGVDLLGYEFNSAEDLSWAMKHIAQWASVPQGTDLNPKDGWDFARDFTVRVHAGETGKRRENVAAVVDVAAEYGVKARIAHALRTDLDAERRSPIRDKIRNLSEKGMLAFELCPPSNLAYNNLDRIENAPLKYWGNPKLSGEVYLSTDGADAIRSTPTQLALDALAAGWKIEDLERMRAREEKFVRKHFEAEASKQKAFNTLYGRGGKPANDAFLEGFTKRLGEINAHTIDKEVGDRLPYFLMGASGTSYEQVGTDLRREIEVGMGMLQHATSPDTAALLFGRVKKEGVTEAADRVFAEYERKHPENPYKVVALAAKGTSGVANSISFIKEIPQERSSIPHNLFKTAAGLKQPAFGIFISGNNFTRDTLGFYHEWSDEFPFGRPFVLWENTPGASMEFAKDVTQHKRCNDGITMLKAIDHQIRRTPEGQRLYPNVIPFDRALYKDGPNGLELDDAKLAKMKKSVEGEQKKREDARITTATDRLAFTSATTGMGAAITTPGKRGGR